MVANKKLLVLSDEFVSLASKGEYGGKGSFDLPKDHVAAIEVPKGGSCCKNCKWVDADKHECKSDYYIKWNGGDPKLPEHLSLEQICSDWYQPNR